jgi:hypothetical protein
MSTTTATETHAGHAEGHHDLGFVATVEVLRFPSFLVAVLHHENQQRDFRSKEHDPCDPEDHVINRIDGWPVG